MSIVLSQENVIQHLRQRRICHPDAEVIQIQPKLAKNFNLLVTLSDRQSNPNSYQLLVKQEPRRPDGRDRDDLRHEGQLHRLLQHPEWVSLARLTSEWIDFDSASGIAVFRYLSDYDDLSQFYQDSAEFPVEIAAALGKALAQIHAGTMDSAAIETASDGADLEGNAEDGDDAIARLEEQCILTPECFGKISTAGLKFYRLYQRFEQLGQAIAHLNESLQPCCLTHSDLKLNNILLHHHWQNLDETNSPHPAIRLIDWERWQWGDPAADLGALVASYLKLWLQSLLVSAGLDIEQSLQFAERPLEALQPSMIALVGSYLQTFAEIGDRVPNFVERVMQFAGLSLIDSIRANLYYYEPFGNQEICTLQVAKTLLCEPLLACNTIFGGIETLEQWQSQPIESVSPSQCGQPTVAAQTPAPQSDESTEVVAQVPTPGHSESIATMMMNLAENLKINSTAHIQHQGYEPLLLPDAIASLSPFELPSWYRQYLICQLGQYLSRIYWSGEERTLQTEQEQSPELSNCKNDQYRGIQYDFYNRLNAANQGNGYPDLDWQIQAQDQQGWLVRKQGLTLLLPCHSETRWQDYKIGDRMSVHLPKNQIDDRYYVAIGNAGMVPMEKAPILQINFNLTAKGAIHAMRYFSQTLNAMQIPFAFKVRFDPTEYDRWDTAILEVTHACYPRVKSLVQQFYQSDRAALRPPIPFLMKPLGIGIGLAEQPPQIPFKTHRYQLLATALLNAWEQKMTTVEAKILAIQSAFEQQGIDWQHPYCRAESLDLI
jgi:hypothetical protein